MRRNPTAPTESRHTRRTWFLAAVILFATLIAYYPTMSAGFIWDDDDYVTNNPHLLDVAGLIRIWQPGTTKQYYPAVFTTFWIERHVWGLNPAGFHIVNIILHALNSLLVWRICRTLNISGAWMIGAVFALHPVHVESVAWITERKNVLSGLFYLSSASLYLRFDEARDQSHPRQALITYGGSLLLFVCALLSKTVTCTLPAALILMLLWRRRAITMSTLAPLIPMFIIGAVLGLHTAHLEQVNVGATGSDFDLSIDQRIIIASRALAFYPEKIIAPWPLVFIYERWEIDGSVLLSYLPVGIVACVVLGATILSVCGRRGSLLALLYFTGTLFPALGFFNVYPMRYSFVADHFQYLASLGIIVLVVSITTNALINMRIRLLVATVILMALGSLTWLQCWAYESEDTLWRWTLRQNPRAFIAHNNLAKILSERGEMDEAIEHYTHAVNLKPEEELMRANLASALQSVEQFDEALNQYNILLERGGEYNMRKAQTLDDLGREEEAEVFFRRSLAVPGSDSEALMLFALHLMRRDRSDEAVWFIQTFIEIRPDDAIARVVLGDAFRDQRMYAEAEAAYRESAAMAANNDERALALEKVAELAELLGSSDSEPVP